MRTHRLARRPRSHATIVAAALVAAMVSVALPSAGVLSPPLLSAGASGTSSRTRPAAPVVAGEAAAQVGEEVALGSLSAAPAGTAPDTPVPSDTPPTAPFPPGDLTVAVTSLRSLLLPAPAGIPPAAGSPASTDAPPATGSVTASPAGGGSAPTAAPTTTTTAPAVPGTAPAAGVWAELRQCESGGNYATDTGNGYYGAYQFSEATWLGIGESGYPNQAPPAVQDAAAEQLQARSGWGQWPACSKKLGL